MMQGINPSWVFINRLLGWKGRPRPLGSGLIAIAVTRIIGD